MTYDDAIKWAGGTQTRLAALLGIDQSSVAGWGGRIPDTRQIQIEHLSRKRPALGIGRNLKADPQCWEFKAKRTEAAQ